MRILQRILILVFALAGVMAMAEDAGSTTIDVANDATYGPYLTDAQGNSLYLYTSDSAQVSTCVDACEGNWPPLASDGEPVAGTGVDASLLDTINRDDGTVQVTYAGAPLYRYVRDEEPGDTNGQRLGGAFFLVSPTGDALKEAVAQSPAEVSDVEISALVEEGQSVFTANCAVCHGAEGQGLVGPAFAENSNLANTTYVIDTILGGIPSHGMPAWDDTLSDGQIASVATFIRSSWSNEFGPVTQDAVAAQR